MNIHLFIHVFAVYANILNPAINPDLTFKALTFIVRSHLKWDTQRIERDKQTPSSTRLIYIWLDKKVFREVQNVLSDMKTASESL